jgi:hypothetical protein
MFAGKVADLKHGGNRRAVQEANLPLEKTIAEAAKESDVSPRAVRMAKEVLRDGTAEDVEAVERGEKTLNAVVEEIKARAEKAEQPASQKSATRLDKTGYPIPDSILPDWQQAAEFSATLYTLSKLKTIVEKALAEKELIFAEVTNTTISTLKNAYTDLKRILPYAVCTTCQGHGRKKCTFCRGRGFISEFAFSIFVPKQTKEIREKGKRAK